MTLDTKQHLNFKLGIQTYALSFYWSKLILDWSKQYWTQNLFGMKFVLKVKFLVLVQICFGRKRKQNQNQNQNHLFI